MWASVWTIGVNSGREREKVAGFLSYVMSRSKDLVCRERHNFSISSIPILFKLWCNVRKIWLMQKNTLSNAKHFCLECKFDKYNIFSILSLFLFWSCMVQTNILVLPTNKASKIFRISRVVHCKISCHCSELLSSNIKI